MKKTVKTHKYSILITNLASLIEQGRKSAVRYVNTALVTTYWFIGGRIVEYEQKGKKRAEYGEELLISLAGDLSSRFGKGFSKSNLFMMRSFYLAYSEQQIFQTLSGKLLSKEKRITLEGSHYRLDLLLYHRVLRCLIAINLKIGEFTHADAGQMNLYINYLKDKEKLPEENDPVGIILCTDKKKTVVEYALGGMNNKVFASKYKLQLPNPNVLKTEIEHERQRLLEMKIVK